MSWDINEYYDTPSNLYSYSEQRRALASPSNHYNSPPIQYTVPQRWGRSPTPATVDPGYSLYPPASPVPNEYHGHSTSPPPSSFYPSTVSDEYPSYSTASPTNRYSSLPLPYTDQGRWVKSPTPPTAEPDFSFYRPASPEPNPTYPTSTPRSSLYISTASGPNEYPDYSSPASPSHYNSPPASYRDPRSEPGDESLKYENWEGPRPLKQ